MAPGWGELAVPEDSLSGWQWGGDSACRGRVLGMFCIAQLGPHRESLLLFYGLTETLGDELSPRKVTQAAGWPGHLAQASLCWLARFPHEISALEALK